MSKFYKSVAVSWLLVCPCELYPDNVAPSSTRLMVKNVNVVFADLRICYHSIHTFSGSDHPPTPTPMVRPFTANQKLVSILLTNHIARNWPPTALLSYCSQTLSLAGLFSVSGHGLTDGWIVLVTSYTDTLILQILANYLSLLWYLLVDFWKELIFSYSRINSEWVSA